MNGNRTEKLTLGGIYSLTLAEGRCSVEALKERLGLDQEEMERRLKRLVVEGKAEVRDGKVLLTKKGRDAVKVVFIGGGFEVIHAGHLHTIEQAKKLGDVLVAVLARDSTIRKTKGREPVADEKQRVRLLSSIRHVDAAILGVEGNIYDTLEKVRPDVVALGYDQRHPEEEIEREAEKRGLRLTVVRLTSAIPEIKTSKILQGF